MPLWAIEIILRFSGVSAAKNEACVCLPYNISQIVILLIEIGHSVIDMPTPLATAVMLLDVTLALISS